jgi:hypothetical protein
LLLKLKPYRTAACVTVLVLAGEIACADPFNWDLADVSEGHITFDNGERVDYRVGYIIGGNYSEMLVLIDRAPLGASLSDQILVRGMATERPKIFAVQNLFVIEETGTPWGQDMPVTYFRCWQSGIPLVDVDCPELALP